MTPRGRVLAIIGTGAVLLGSKEAKGPAYDAAAAQVAEGDRSKLLAAWPSFSAAQRVAAYERAQKQTRAQSQVRDQGMTR